MIQFPKIGLSDIALKTDGIKQVLDSTATIFIVDIPGRATKKRMQLPAECKLWNIIGTRICLSWGVWIFWVRTMKPDLRIVRSSGKMRAANKLHSQADDAFSTVRLCSN